MNMTLFKTTLKKNWLLWIIFYGVLTMYMTVMLSMFKPGNLESIKTMLDAFPQEMMKAFGFSAIETELTGFLASWLYGMLMIGFPMVYSIILCNRLVAKMVDNGSFACLLSTPHSRVTLVVTRGFYALVSMLALFAAVFGTGVAACAAMHPGLLDVSRFFNLNLTTMLVNMTVMMICFFFSCLFNDSKLSIGFGAGFPIAFLLMKMLGDIDYKILREISIYGFYDPVEIAHGASATDVNLIYLGLIIVLFVSGVWIFKKKRLPL